MTTDTISELAELPAHTRVAVGDTVRVRLPFTEACMCLCAADQVRHVQVLADGAQLLDTDGHPHSFPITHAEAGILRDHNGLYLPPERHPEH